jgi:RNA polymerase sigma-70 factor, ECF subfamily
MQDAPGNSEGTPDAMNRVWGPHTAWSHEETYNGLRRLAASYLRRERRAHTLQPTALVHEGLARHWAGATGRPDGQDRARFIQSVARAMRQVLIDHARRRNAAKRGGGPGPTQRLPLDEALTVMEGPRLDLLALDEALLRLSHEDPDLARIVELRFFGGFTERQIADLLGIGVRSVTRAWAFARLWLSRELQSGGSECNG